ncbi:ACSF2, partial [Cordylochernes scorpioides]
MVELSEVLYYRYVELRLKINIFTFNSKYYKQTNGSPKGSPLSSPLAEIVMRHIDQTIVSRFPNIIQIWKRYIDDIFCICQTDKINDILTEINSLHSELNFTIEKENNHSLPFLDILITKNNSQYTSTIDKVGTPEQRYYIEYNSEPIGVRRYRDWIRWLDTQGGRPPLTTFSAKYDHWIPIDRQKGVFPTLEMSLKMCQHAEKKGLGRDDKEGSNESSTPRGKDGFERTYHKEGLLLKAKEESGRVRLLKERRRAFEWFKKLKECVTSVFDKPKCGRIQTVNIAEK